jgi:CRP/FNR family transcriptional regulator, cyclic AMP receptor protein
MNVSRSSAGRGHVERGTFVELLSDSDRDELLKLGGLRRYARGEHLMHQDEPGDRVLILLRGHVKATFVDSDGHEMVLSFQGPGDVLGELSFARAEPRSSNVIAIESVEARGLAASEFRAYLQRRPTALLALIEVLSTRFRDADRKRVQFGHSDTVGRIAARLIELGERYGVRDEAGIRIDLPITQDDLRGWTGASRTGVAAALRTMRELGWIRTERRRITILDVDALSERAA